jgi:hypothetical protein
VVSSRCRPPSCSLQVSQPSAVKLLAPQTPPARPASPSPPHAPTPHAARHAPTPAGRRAPSCCTWQPSIRACPQASGVACRICARTCRSTLGHSWRRRAVHELARRPPPAAVAIGVASARPAGWPGLHCLSPPPACFRCRRPGGGCTLGPVCQQLYVRCLLQRARARHPDAQRAADAGPAAQQAAPPHGPRLLPRLRRVGCVPCLAARVPHTAWRPPGRTAPSGACPTLDLPRQAASFPVPGLPAVLLQWAATCCTSPCSSPRWT